METRPQTVASFFQELEENITQQRLTLGGYIAVLGGTVDVIGCKNNRCVSSTPKITK